MRLYDAPACPFCARVRLVLAEKHVAYETIEIDLKARPEWIYGLNPSGRVPVLEDGFALAESLPIIEYLEERSPEPALLPSDLAARALARLAMVRFDELLGNDYYALRRGRAHEIDARLDALPVGLSLLSDFAYLPWVIRLRARREVALPARIEAWLRELARRPSVAAELELARALA
jgi:glutathione S-transferase